MPFEEEDFFRQRKFLPIMSLTESSVFSEQGKEASLQTSSQISISPKVKIIKKIVLKFYLPLVSSYACNNSMVCCVLKFFSSIQCYDNETQRCWKNFNSQMMRSVNKLMGLGSN